MRTPREIFLAESELVANWNKFAKGPDFPKVMTFARAEISRMAPTPEMLKGVDMLENILLSIGDKEDEHGYFPKPGLKHDLDIDRNRGNKPENQQKEKVP